MLITPTGLGAAQTEASGALGRAVYALGRHTPLGDLLIRGLSSAPSVRWFQEHQTYADPDHLTDEEVRERMSGNLCRCGAYVNIVAAIQDVAGAGGAA